MVAHNTQKIGKVIKLGKTKTRRFRGSRTCGRGKKGGRGAGLRGGRGNAGLHKHKYMHMLKYMPDHFGVHGFTRHSGSVKTERVINVGQLNEVFHGKKEIDLTKEGYDKLLGSGFVDKGLKIKVKKATEKAVEKVKEKGGDVALEA